MKRMTSSLEQLVARHLTQIGEIGRDDRGGWTRLAFSPEESEVHEYARVEDITYATRVQAQALNILAEKDK